MQTVFSRGAPIKAWIDGVHVEETALNQLRNVALMPFVTPHLAVMPDVHAGIGATVGSVIPTVGAIIPAAVGVDIGCGMSALRTTLTAADLPDSLAPMRSAIEAAVPVGAASFNEVPRLQEATWYSRFKRRYEDIEAKHPKFAPKKSAAHQLGTLGGGNHFIEVCLDESDNVWIMLHSGSRGIGNRIGSYFIAKAKEEMVRLGISVPDVDLAYLSEGSVLFADYVEAVSWAQDYAFWNREMMRTAVLDAIEPFLPPFVEAAVAIQCHHNYVARENHFGQDVWLTRKGAVSAREGELGIIPGSMGTRSYIVRGKGNAESFHTCSHGAGRMMSRTEAKKRFTVDDHVAATEGIECRKDAGVVDETPAAYKDIDKVIAAQSELIEVVHTLKQVLCVKG